MITVGHKTELCELAEKHGTDKWFYYTSLYHELLKGKRQTAKKVLEIGIGSADVMLDSLSRMGITTYKSGASLRMWRDYFPNAHIYGLDKDRKACEEASFDTDRITLWQGDSTKVNALAYASAVGFFDLIVDDGEHQKDAQMDTLNALCPILEQDGIYIVEDVGYLNRPCRIEFAKAIPYPAELFEFHNPKLGPHIAACIVVRP